MRTLWYAEDPKKCMTRVSFGALHSERTITWCCAVFFQVEHVLLYDFPRDPIEYMRRVGRTARAGRKGVVTVLAWGRQVSITSLWFVAEFVQTKPHAHLSSLPVCDEGWPFVA